MAITCQSKAYTCIRKQFLQSLWWTFMSFLVLFHWSELRLTLMPENETEFSQQYVIVWINVFTQLNTSVCWKRKKHLGRDDKQEFTHALLVLHAGGEKLSNPKLVLFHGKWLFLLCSDFWTEDFLMQTSALGLHLNVWMVNVNNQQPFSKLFAKRKHQNFDSFWQKNLNST